MRRAGTESGWLVAAAALALIGALGCSKTEEEPGRMVLSLYADMAIPKDVDSIQIEVLSDGALRPPTDAFKIGPGGHLLPATLALVGNDDPTTTATVTVWSFSNGVPRTLRRVVTQVPPARLSLLRVPIQWLCEGNVKDTGGVPISKCPEGESCVAGKCVEDTDNPLPGYGTGDVFGGGDGTDASTGTCFDTVTCLDQGFDVAVKTSDCSIALPSGDPEKINLGLVTELGDAGICGRKDCYVPLDKSELFGWYVAGSRIMLPGEACKRITEGSVTAVRLATGPCASKQIEIPTCGPWSSVGTYTEQSSKECDRLCTAVASSKCSDDTAAKCFARCYPGAGVCDAIIDDYAKCGEGFAFKPCPGNQGRTEPAPECTAQAERFQVCRKCARAALDECDYCTCRSCETAVTACDANPACAKIVACAERVHCRGKACDTPCQAELAVSTAAAQLFQAIGDCRTASCAGTCTGK
ncbi:MAG: hypothetical protein HYZ29_30645 [Myxococcales bacterium]|nr:hypothetical protein [Myxococcales bacterium]